MTATKKPEPTDAAEVAEGVAPGVVAGRTTISSVIDARLWPVAIALWVSEASVLLLGGRQLWMVWAVLWLALVAGGFGVFGLARRRPQHATYSRALVIASVVASVLAGSALAALRLEPLMAREVVVLGESHAAAQIEAKLSAPPRLVRTPTATPEWETESAQKIRWTAPATLTQVVEGDRTLHLAVPVLLLGSATDQRELDALVPSSRVSGQASVRSGEPSRGTALLVRFRGSPDVIGEPPLWQDLASDVRHSMRAASANLDGDAKGLLPGLVVGDESALSEELREQMQRTGLSHLTAVSGANLAIITGAVLAVAMAFRVPRGPAVIVAGLALLGFVTVVGPQPSVLRAAVMGGVALLALFTRSPRVGFTALAVSVTVVLLIDPWMSVSMGFGLSVAATGGLLIYAQSATARAARRAALETPRQGESVVRGQTLRRRIWRGVLLGLGVASAAQLATLPLVASFGDGLPLMGVVANLLAEPAVPFATVLGCLAAGLGLVAPDAAMVVAEFAGLAAWWIAEVAQFCSALPAAVVPWPEGMLGFSFAALLVAGLVLGWLRRRSLLATARTNPRQLAAIFTAMIAVVALWRATAPPWPPPGWLVVACDVGQGDALVVATGDRRAMLIDAGPDPSAIAGCLSDLKVDVIDVLVLSHFHADHVDGLEGAIAQREVGTAIVSPLAEPAAQYREVVRLLEQRGITYRIAAPGEQAIVGNARYEVLWPREVLQSQGSAPNNASVVLAVEVGTPGVKVLFTGDLESPAQQAVLASVDAAAFDVVKVPHHGSRNQDPRLATSFPAGIALISVGATNLYGHPAASTIEQWRKVGARIARTDQFGDVAIGRDANNELYLMGRDQNAPES